LVQNSKRQETKRRNFARL